MKPTSIFYTLAILIPSLSLIPAQTPNIGNINLSKNCQNTLVGFLNSTSLGSCIPFLQLGVLANATLSSSSLPTNAQSALSPDTISKVNSVVTAVCTYPKCNDTTVSGALSTFNSGCQTDLNQNSPIALAIQGFISLYSPIRDSLCFKNSTGGYCVLENVGLAQDVIDTSSSFRDVSVDKIPASELCTTCNKAILNTMFNYENNHTGIVPASTDKDQTTFKSAVTSKCGASFLDGNVPISPSGSVSGSSSDASAPAYLQQSSMYFASLAVLLVTFVTVF